LGSVVDKLIYDWTFKERNKCRVGILELPAWRKRVLVRKGCIPR